MVEHKEKPEATLVRLLSLKHQVSSLRPQLDALRALQSEKQKKALLGNRCEKAIGKGEEITIKSALEEIKRF